MFTLYNGWTRKTQYLAVPDHAYNGQEAAVTQTPEWCKTGNAGVTDPLAVRVGA